ncbi:MAG: glycosyltransferase family 2 protein [Anaerolineales bacterium]
MSEDKNLALKHIIDQHPDVVITVVIPAYNVAGHILEVLATIPAYISRIVVVLDAPTDHSAQLVEQIASQDERILVVHHENNKGVGGAMVSGFERALELGSNIIVKMDGDAQMDPGQLPGLLMPLLTGQADFTKGNRFYDFVALRKMPFIRLVGNLSLSFLIKAVTGYWKCFDPTNGYIAIRGEVLRKLNFSRLDQGYFFEISLLSQLYLANAFLLDIPMPAIYGSETSNLRVRRVLLEYPFKIINTGFHRIIFKYFLYDFSLISIYMLFGTILGLFGLIFGIINWVRYDSIDVGAPTGTIMVAMLTVIMSFQLLLQAITMDYHASPSRPITKPLITSQE